MQSSILLSLMEDLGFSPLPCLLSALVLVLLLIVGGTLALGLFHLLLLLFGRFLVTTVCLLLFRFRFLRLCLLPRFVLLACTGLCRFLFRLLRRSLFAGNLLFRRIWRALLVRALRPGRRRFRSSQHLFFGLHFLGFALALASGGKCPFLGDGALALEGGNGHVVTAAVRFAVGGFEQVAQNVVQDVVAHKRDIRRGGTRPGGGVAVLSLDGPSSVLGMDGFGAGFVFLVCRVVRF
mmetsp:Transcript_17635/g.48782  ORF Transcript_17635/g.48782 Transcript_17635/m.48782 type:complete len:236 (+) Transcript_17635:800-1507(+)